MPRGSSIPSRRLAAAAAVSFLALLHSPGDAAVWSVENRSPDHEASRFAAQELRRYLARHSGTTVETGGASHVVVLGLDIDLTDGERADLPAPHPGSDRFSVSIRGAGDAPRRWLIAGSEPRSILYGAYSVLERLGWRWFHPALDPLDPEIVPATAPESLAETSWSNASPLGTRVFHWYEGRPQIRQSPPSTEELRAQIDWAAKARYNTIITRALELDGDAPARRTVEVEAKRRGLRLQSPEHNFELFLPSTPEALAQDPDWFGLVGGTRRPHNSLFGAQFCWTHEGAARQFIENATRFVKERPNLDVLGVSGLDGGRALPCECDRCAKSTPTDRYLALVNQLVEVLAEAAPDVVVEALVGYQHLRAPPRTVRPHPRLRARFAVWQRNPAKGYSEDEFGPLLAAWASVFDGRITAYQYYSDHAAGPRLPAPYTIQITSDLKEILRLGADGALNLLYPDEYWWTQTLNAYLAGRSFFDPTVSAEELLRGYARRYFGPSAGPLMASYYDDLAARPAAHRRIWHSPSREDVARLDQLDQSILEPAAARAARHPIYRHRMSKARLWHDLMRTTARASSALDLALEAARAGRTEEARTLIERAHIAHEALEQLSVSPEVHQGGLAHHFFIGGRREHLTRSIEEIRAALREDPRSRSSPAPH